MTNPQHFIFIVTLLMAACATTAKFDTSGIDLSISPQRAALEAMTLQGTPLLWGGVIIAANNLEDATQFEILAYPLDSKQKPDTRKTPLGRFLAIQTGYLEISDYAQGRLISVSGILQQNRSGRIGEIDYTYPVLRIIELQLWPKPGESSETQIHFGIGVMIHN